MASIPSSELTQATPVVDGLVPEKFVAPASPNEIADVLASAADESIAVVPVGGGTSLAFGNIPERYDVALSTSKLTGFISYEPTDLTLSVWAGSRFSGVNMELAERGQTLPIDVPDDNATIGGLIATGLAGPRRSGSPTFRDLLIGISAAHPSGTVTKAGGMVVKNVTGFDLMRLYLGSLGTLGVIVSANFKVLPLAPHEVSIVAFFRDLLSAIEAGEKVRASRVRPVALEVFRRVGDGWSVAVRLEGRESTVRLLASEVETALKGDQHTVEADASKEWWRAFARKESATTSGSDAVLRCSTRPRQAGELLRRAATLLDERGTTVSHLSMSPSSGSVVVRIAAQEGADGRAAFLGTRDALLATTENVTVIAAPPSWKAGIDVWGRPPETLDIMKALKAQFDPARVLNPRRFTGGI